ncbi:MAG TPA: ABC transporter substrate-binding protein [Streptosporangiaceae bacterium]|nr:ABC transporter substrate-binding protein [Streptosporangiaceae bacterium]
MAAATVLAAVACSSSGGSQSSKTSKSSSNTSVTAQSKPEKTHIKVATLPIADAADLFIAINKGYFRKQGLTVTPEIIQATPQITPDLVSGKMDFSLLNYVSTMEIEQNGGIKFKYVSPGTVAAANVSEILVPKGSPIKSLADLKGKKIGSPQTTGAIGNLAVDVTLKAHGIDPRDVTFVATPFPDELTALARHQVDAVWATEPFNTVIKKSLGAQPLVDTMTGQMSGFLVGGWGTLASYAQKYPKTVAAFQRAMAQAQQVAASDHGLVVHTVPTYTSTKAGIASVMSFDTFPSALTATQLQNAASLMLQNGFLHAKLDVAPMLQPGPAS